MDDVRAAVPHANFESRMTAVALRQETAFDQQATPSRGEVLARYHRLRAIGKQHHANVLAFLSRDAIPQHARRLGLLKGRTFVLDSMDELILAADLAIHTAPPGRSRAIDRYANAARCADGSEEALMLDAMRRACFTVVQVRDRHPSAGLIVDDLCREIDLWLVDEGLEKSLAPGAAFATRLYAPGPFVMTAGVGMPVDRGALRRAIESAPQLGRKPGREAFQDRRFAEAVYRGAIADGTMENVAYRDPHGDGDEG